VVAAPLPAVGTAVWVPGFPSAEAGEWDEAQVRLLPELPDKVQEPRLRRMDATGARIGSNDAPPLDSSLDSTGTPSFLPTFFRVCGALDAARKKPLFKALFGCHSCRVHASVRD
jgi:hypothetical protein